MAHGLDNKAIGRELGLRLTTIRSYVQDILEKLDAHSKLEAVAAAARHDLLTELPSVAESETSWCSTAYRVAALRDLTPNFA